MSEISSLVILSFKKNPPDITCRYVKDAHLTPKRKQLFVYLLERLERETGGQKITIVFDCQGAGIRNIEIEAIQFIMQVRRIRG